MRIGILSDIHVDLNGGQPVIEALLATIHRRGVETMVIAGDVSSDYRLTLESLDQLQERSGLPLLFVPGNHDIWNEAHPDITAWQAYEALERFPGNLSRGPQEIADGWTIIGDLGWYDYSFGGAQYSREDFDRMQFGERIWQDRIKANWDRHTLEMHRTFYEKLDTQLEKITSAKGSGSDNHKLILVTHVLPRKEFTVQRPDPEWIYLNAFLGSPEYGELALAYGVRYSICGHVHYRKQATVKGTRFICNCLGYSDEWRWSRDPIIEIDRAFLTVDLD
ncbi:MAG: metallophosphoesterase family protein [Spirochaetaceae bacterium]|nr:MAG: metallophosphoesterase family protein [Spirochaetaceae bacterium]